MNHLEDPEYFVRRAPFDLVDLVSSLLNFSLLNFDAVVFERGWQVVQRTAGTRRVVARVGTKAEADSILRRRSADVRHTGDDSGPDLRLRVQ